jgi:hypothetical protein
MSILKNLKDKSFFDEVCKAISELHTIEEFLRDAENAIEPNSDLEEELDEWYMTFNSFENELDAYYSDLIAGCRYTEDAKDEIRANFFALDTFLSDVEAWCKKNNF